MNPDWSTAPSWANWLAMDDDGWWFWFGNKPEFCDDEGTWFVDDDDNNVICASEGPDESGDVDWDHAFNTLEPRP